MFAVLGHMPEKSTARILLSLQADKASGKFQHPDAKLSFSSRANQNIDALLVHHFKVAVLHFAKCSNGGGLCITFWKGIEHFARSKYNVAVCIQVD